MPFRIEWFLADAYEQCNKDYEKGAPEVLILPNGPKDTPEQYRLYRLDYAAVTDGEMEPIDFNIEECEPRKMVQVHHDSGVDLQLYPMVWNGCEFCFQTKSRSWAPFEAWLNKWLDPEEKIPTDTYGLSGVIHNVTKPERSGTQWNFSVDFGSSPADCFHELVEALNRMGVKRASVGSFSLLDGGDHLRAIAKWLPGS